jgi:hypothetical protein
MLLAPLMHAAALTGQSMATVLEWLDTRDFRQAETDLKDADAGGRLRPSHRCARPRPRDRETTIMSATNLLRAYRYPRVTRTTSDELTPEAFFTGGQANTIYVLAAAHHQRELQPVILALVSAIYETDRTLAPARTVRSGALPAARRDSQHRSSPRPRSLARAMRRPRHHDRHPLAIHSPNRPPLPQSRARRDTRRLHRANLHRADRRSHHNRLHRRTTRARAHRTSPPSSGPARQRNARRQPTTSRRARMAASDAQQLIARIP